MVLVQGALSRAIDTERFRKASTHPPTLHAELSLSGVGRHHVHAVLYDTPQPVPLPVRLSSLPPSTLSQSFEARQQPDADPLDVLSRAHRKVHEELTLCYVPTSVVPRRFGEPPGRRKGHWGGWKPP